MYQSRVDYLNLEYLLTRSYDYVVNFHWSAVAVALPAWSGVAITALIVVGMVAALTLLLLIVYANIRLVMVEHEGFLSKGTAEHRVDDVEVAEQVVAQTSAQHDRWKNIEQLGTSPNHGDWRRAILEADIMLSDALASVGYTGPTVGDQLKLTNPLQVTSVRSAWDAHMVRNRIAHGGEGYELSQREAQTALNNYKRVFDELGFI